MMKQYMTADYLFRLGQDRFINADFDKAIKFLRLANAKGHEEASWLISLMEKTPLVREYAQQIRPWCRSLFEKENSDRAFCYRLWFSDYNEQLDFELSKYAANTGNPLGQYNHYAVILYYNYVQDLKDKIDPYVYLEKATAQGLILAIVESAKLEEAKINKIRNDTDDCTISMYDLTSRHMQLRLRGAELGDVSCMKYVSEAYNKIKDRSIFNTINAMKWLYRSYIYGDRSQHFAEQLDTIKSFIEICSASVVDRRINCINVYFTVGREADGYEEFFPVFEEESNHDSLQDAIKFYRTIIDAARESALCTIWALRPILSKDVATIIAKLVYDSRLDPIVWLSD